jgi:hypothetical protein
MGAGIVGRDMKEVVIWRKRDVVRLSEGGREG